MFRFSLLTALLFTAHAYAYFVTLPGQTASWTSTGPNTIAWQRVNTDPGTFSVVLVNEDRSVLPVNNQLLADAVDGTSGSSIAVSPPAGQSFPVGSGFRINFIKSATDVNTIYAQSSEFTITQGSVITVSSGSATAVTGTAMTTGTVTAAGSGSVSLPHTTYTAPLTETSTEAPTPVQHADASVRLPSSWGSLITALVVTVITI